MSSFSPSPTPILLLKTRSKPTDNYAAFFASNKASSSPAPTSFSPTFIPVLTHQRNLTPLLYALGPNCTFPTQYGGLIFTSQRAVEALDAALQQLSSSDTHHTGRLLDDYYNTHSTLPPLYTVGPATSAALQRVANAHFAVATRFNHLENAPYPVLGADTGNGEKLAQFILENYDPPRPASGAETDGNGNADHSPSRAPLLFFVGEQRRDIIPRTLMNLELPPSKQIRVDEVVVYETAVEEGFEREFGEVLSTKHGKERVWIVVFSPTGCAVMLKVLGWTREGGWPEAAMCESEGQSRRRWYVATIGPTTRDYMSKEFGFEADVCAEKPSPEGIAEGIEKFESS